MRKILLSIMLVVALILSAFLMLPAKAAGSMIAFDNNTAKVGETIRVTVKVSNNNIRGCSFNLLYDDSMLEYKDCKGTGSPSFSNGKATTKVSDGTVNSCTIYFTFNVKKSGAAIFQVREVSTLDIYSKSTSVEGASAKLNIVEATAAETTTKPVVQETTTKHNIENNTSVGNNTIPKITFDGKECSIVTDYTNIEIPEGFRTTSTKYNNVDVAGLTSSDFSVLLLCLTNGYDNPFFVVYNSNNGTVSPYKTTSISEITILDFPESKVPKGFNLLETKIDNQDVSCCQNESFKNNNRYLVYGIKDGKTNIYVYDSNESTYQKYIAGSENDTEGSTGLASFNINGKEIEMDFELFVALACGICGIFCLLLAMVIASRSKNKELQGYLESGACLMREIDNEDRVIKEYIYNNKD